MLISLLLTLACNKGTDTDSLPVDTNTEEAPDPATVVLAGACPLDQAWGGFSVQASTNANSNGVGGKVSDSIWPWSELEEIASEGDCKLLRRNLPFCSPSCDVGTTCDFDGQCVPEPSNQDLGTVTVKGLVQAVSMEPVIGNTYYDTSLPYPMYTAGDLVTLNTGGGAYGPQTLYGVAVEPLSLDAEEWFITKGEPLEITWDPPTTQVVRSSIDLRINMDVHGASPASLYCTFEDDGAATVSGALTKTLVEAGVTGFPSGALERHTTDSVDLDPGCMAFRVLSPVIMAVDVDGFTPCFTDEECPEGLTCNTELQVCA